ncbi:hypothetical protein J6590_082276 [Homalodisca vitripennis]|nr:hypothetical protein J6590_082276 [Homalodisca vitripennis]
MCYCVQMARAARVKIVETEVYLESGTFKSTARSQTSQSPCVRAFQGHDILENTQIPEIARGLEILGTGSFQTSESARNRELPDTAIILRCQRLGPSRDLETTDAARDQEFLDNGSYQGLYISKQRNLHSVPVKNSERVRWRAPSDVLFSVLGEKVTAHGLTAVPAPTRQHRGISLPTARCPSTPF